MPEVENMATSFLCNFCPLFKCGSISIFAQALEPCLPLAAKNNFTTSWSSMPKDLMHAYGHLQASTNKYGQYSPKEEEEHLDWTSDVPSIPAHHRADDHCRDDGCFSSRELFGIEACVSKKQRPMEENSRLFWLCSVN